MPDIGNSIAGYCTNFTLHPEFTHPRPLKNGRLFALQIAETDAFRSVCSVAEIYDARRATATK
jgi:hypothetical protein